VPTAGSNPPPTYVFIRPNTSGAVAGPNLGYYSRFSIARPSELLLMIDALPNSGAVISGASGFDEWVKPTCEGDNVRHRGRANMLFADGRVEGRHYTRKDASDNEAIEANRDKWLRLDPTN
jgi:prepilin-type processing-associated H-X9-DG protein